MREYGKILLIWCLILVHALAGDIHVNKCVLEFKPNSQIAFTLDFLDTVSVPILPGDIVTIPTPSTFVTKVLTCFVMSNLADFEVSVVIENIVVTALDTVATGIVPPVSLLCNTIAAPQVTYIPVANSLQCASPIAFNIQANLVMTAAYPTSTIIFALNPPTELTSYVRASDTTILFKHFGVQPVFDFLEGKLSPASCTCMDPDSTNKMTTVFQLAETLRLTITAGGKGRLHCACEVYVHNAWSPQPLVAEISIAGIGVVFFTPEPTYMPAASKPAASVQMEMENISERNIFQHGFPEMVFRILDVDGNMVYSDGDMWIELFLLPAENLSFTPQLLSRHRTSVKLNVVDCRYVIPEATVFVGGIGLQSTANSILMSIHAVLRPGYSFRHETSVTPATREIRITTTRRLLSYPAARQEPFVTVQRTNSYANPGYTVGDNLVDMGAQTFVSPSGLYAPTLYLPQGETLPGSTGIWEHERSGVPRPRLLSADAKAVSQRRVYIVGGQVLQSSTLNAKQRTDAVLMDVWVYDVVSGTHKLLYGNQHMIALTAIKGSVGEFNHAYHPAARHSAAAAVDIDERYLYLHGGCVDVPCRRLFADLWVFDLQRGMWAWLAGATTATSTVPSCSSTTVLPPLFGHQMATTGTDITQTEPSKVTTTNMGLKPDDVLYIFGGATLNPSYSSDDVMEVGRHFASNAFLRVPVRINRELPVTFLGILPFTIKGMLCGDTVSSVPSEGSFLPFAGLTPESARTNAWHPPAAVYSSMVYDPYRQVLWLYGGMHRAPSFDAARPESYSTVAHGHAGSTQRPISGNMLQHYIALTDSGALSWLWKYDIARALWVLVSSNEGQSPAVGRGVPRLVLSDARTTSQPLLSSYSHPGSRVLTALTIDATHVYLAGGMGHAAGAVLPLPHGVMNTQLNVQPYVNPNNKLLFTPLALGHLANIGTTLRQYLHVHAFYPFETVFAAGFQLGMPLQGLEVLVKMHPEHAFLGEDGYIETAVLIEQRTGFPTPTESYDIAQKLEFSNKIHYRQLRAGAWISVGVNSGTTKPYWRTGELHVAIIQRFTSLVYQPNTPGVVSGAEMRQGGRTAAMYYRQAETAMISRVIHEAVPTIMLRSKLVPVYNPLRMALPLAYDGFDPNMDDIWRVDVSHEAFKQDIPPFLHTNPVHPQWQLISGSLAPNQATYPPVYLPNTALDWPLMSSYALGPRSGAVILAPQPDGFTVRSTDPLQNVFIVGGFRVHAPREQFSPAAGLYVSSPSLPIREDTDADMLIPEMLVYDDVWSLRLSTNCLDTQFAYSKFCAKAPARSSNSLSSSLVSEAKSMSSGNSCDLHNCGGQCVRAAGHFQCLCEDYYGTSVSFNPTTNLFSTNQGEFCSASHRQYELTTSSRFVWTLALPNYKAASPMSSPGTRFGAAVTADNHGCVWLYGGRVAASSYPRDLWRHCPGSEEWQRVWAASTNTIYMNASPEAIPITPDVNPYETLPTNLHGIGEPGVAVKGVLFFGKSSRRHPVTDRPLVNEDALFLYAISPFQYASIWEYKPSTKVWNLRYRYNGLASSPAAFATATNIRAASTGTYNSGNAPAIREAPAAAAHNGKLYVYSGGALQSSVQRVPQYHLDVWVFDSNQYKWALLWGTDAVNASPYETAVTSGPTSHPSPIVKTIGKGLFDYNNSPGCRVAAAAAMSPDGKFLYVHGGVRPSSHARLFLKGADTSADEQANLGRWSLEILEDLWVFDVITAEWAWIAGSLEPASPKGRTGTYVTRTQHDLNAPPARFLHSMAISATGYLHLDRGLTVIYPSNDGALGGKITPLNDLFLLYLPTLTLATRGIAQEVDMMSGTIPHRIGSEAKWMIALGTKNSHTETPTFPNPPAGRATSATNYVMQPSYGHTSLLIPGVTPSERAFEEMSLSQAQLESIRTVSRAQIRGQLYVSLTGPTTNPYAMFNTAPLIKGVNFLQGQAFMYVWGNPCDRIICLNNGRCVTPGLLITDEATAHCECPINTYGTYCEYTFCDLYPCHNGGTCLITPGETPSGPTCFCPEGFTGRFCDTPTYVVTPLASPTTNDRIGPGHHFLAASTVIPLLPRDIDIMQVPHNTRASILSGGYLKTGTAASGIAISLSATTWLYSESTGVLLDLAKLLSEFHGNEYTAINDGAAPKPNGRAPWGGCGGCSHFGARAGHSIAFIRDSRLSDSALVLPDGGWAADTLIIFGGYIAPGGVNVVVSNQVWEVSLADGAIEYISGVRPTSDADPAPVGMMTPPIYDNTISTPRHEVGELTFMPVRMPSGRAHHAGHVLTVDGKRWLYVYGGFGADRMGQVGFLGDLWRMDIERFVTVTNSEGDQEVRMNPSYRQWQYIGCSVSHRDYIFLPTQSDPYHTLGANTPLFVKSPGGLEWVGCPSARAYAASSVDSRNRLWVVGGVGARGPLDDVWVYDPSVTSHGAWYRLQGTQHSGHDPSTLNFSLSQGQLLWYIASLTSGLTGSSVQPFHTFSHTTTATYPELGHGCVIGLSCPLHTTHKREDYRMGDDADKYSPDFTRIGAIVAAAATATVDGNAMMLYGGLTRTRTYLCLYDNLYGRFLSKIPAVRMPMRLDTPEGKFYLFYTREDLESIGLHNGGVLTQLSLGLATTFSGTYQVRLSATILNTYAITAQSLDAINLAPPFTVSETTGHVQGGYLNLLDLNLQLSSIADPNTLIIVIYMKQEIPGHHSTILACASLSQSEITHAALNAYSIPQHLARGRMAVSRFDMELGALTDHTFVACIPSVRINTRAVATMGPSNLLWSIDMSKPTDALRETTIALISGSLPTKKRAKYTFLSVNPAFPPVDTDPIGAIGYAYTHGLHAAIPEAYNDWIRYDGVPPAGRHVTFVGSDTLFNNLVGYDITRAFSSPSVPSSTAVPAPFPGYPPALAFGSLFATSTDAVYLFGGVSSLHTIDARDNPDSDNTFPPSSKNPVARHTVDTPFTTSAATTFANPYVFSFGEPVPLIPFRAKRPTLLRIAFSADFTTIHLDFDVDTQMPSVGTTFTAATCTMLLTPESLALITTFSRCAWTSRRRLTIQLFEQHRVNYGSTLGIRSFLIYAVDPMYPRPALAKNLSVQRDAPSRVQAVISTSEISVPCQGLVLSAISSTGAYGQRMLHHWMIIPSTDVDNSEHIQAFNRIIASLPTDTTCADHYSDLPPGTCQSELRLTAAQAADVLPAGYTTRISLQVTNRFRDTHTTTISIFRTNNIAPMVTVERFQYRKEFNAPLLVAAAVTASRCALPSAIVRRSLGITWTLESGTNPVNFTDASQVVLNGYNLVMVPYGLWLGAYTFTATVTETHYNAAGEIVGKLPTTTAPITVEIFTTAPTATLTGAVDRTVSLRYLRNGILARDLAVPNVVYTDTSDNGEDTSQPQPVVTLSAATSTDPTANPATSSTPPNTLRFTWECHLADGSTPCFSDLTTSDGSLATLSTTTHTLHIAASTLDALSKRLELDAMDSYLMFTVLITRTSDGATTRASSWLKIDRTTDISVSLSLSSPHTTTSAALIHSQPHDMVVSAALSSSTTAAEDPDAVLPVLRWYSTPALNFTEIALALSRPAHASDLIIPSSYLLPNTKYTFYVHLFDVVDAPPAEAYLDPNGVPVSTSAAFATTSLAVFVQDFPTLGECELATLGPYAPMASMDLQTLNATTCESGLCRLRASCRDWPESSVFEWLLQTDTCTKQHSTTTGTTTAATTDTSRNLGFGHRSVSSITDDNSRIEASRRRTRSVLSTTADEPGCSDTVQIAPGTAASAIEFVASIDSAAELLIRVSLVKAVRYVSLPLPAPTSTATINTTAVLIHVEAVLDELARGDQGEDTADMSKNNSISAFVVADTTPHCSSMSTCAPVGYRVRTNGVVGAGATGSVGPTIEVSTEQLQVLLSGANVINTLLAASTPMPKPGGKPQSLESSPQNMLARRDHADAVAELGVGVSVDEYDGDTNIYASAHHDNYGLHSLAEKQYTKSDLLLLQQRVLRVLTSNATNLATYGAMSPTHSTAQDLINSVSSSSVVSEATLRAIAAPCTNPTTAYARVHCTDMLVRAFTAYSARNIQEGVPTEVADSVLQRLAAVYDNFNATTLALSSARVLKPYTLADYAIDPTSLSATPQRTTPLPTDGSVTEADAALQRAHWEAVRISQQLLAAAKTAAFGDVSLRQPESPPRLLVSDSISVLVDAQYVSNAPTSITIGNDFRVTLPTDLASMLAAPSADPFVSDADTPHDHRHGVHIMASSRDDVDIEEDASIAVAQHTSLDNIIDAPPYKQQLCASARANATQTLQHVLAAYCGDLDELSDGHTAPHHIITTTVRGITASRMAMPTPFTQHVSSNTTRAARLRAIAAASTEGLVPVTLKGTTMTKTLTSIISTAPALMRLVSADNRHDTHVASSSVVDVTMYNHTDAGRRDMAVDAMGIAQVQPLQWKPAPPTGDHTAAETGAAGTTMSTLTDTSPSHFYFTFALPELATARWAKLKKKPVPRCQFFLPTALTDGVTTAEDNGTGTSGDKATLSAPTVGEWSTEGCELVSVTATHATCRCSHLTYFRISFSLDDLFPSINLLSWDDFANLTWANLMKYPAPLITCLVWLGALCLLVAVAWVFDVYYDKRGLVELAEQWNKVMIASTDLSYVPSRAVVLDYKRYGLPQSPKDFDMCEYMLMSQYDQLGQWYVDVDALSMDQRQRKAAMKARAATVRANDAHAIAAAKAAVAAVNEEMRIEEGNEEEEDEVAMYEDAGADEVTDVMVVLPEQPEDDTHNDAAAGVDVAPVNIDVSAAVAEEQVVEEPVALPVMAMIEEAMPPESAAEEQEYSAHYVDEDDEEYDVVDDAVFDAMYPNAVTAAAPADTPAEAPAAMVVETMSEDDMLIHSTAFDAPAAPRRPGRLTISRTAYNERMKAKAKAKPPAQHALLQNRLLAAPYYAGAIVASDTINTFTPFDANDAAATDDDINTPGADGPLANPPPPPANAHEQPARGSVADLRRPTMAYPAANSTTSKRASMSNAVYPGATSTTGRRSIATVPYAAAGLADEGAPVFVTMTSVEAGMDAPYAKDTGRGSVDAPPSFYASKSVDAAVYARANNAGRRASVVPPRPSLFSRPAFARPLTLRASVVAPESKAAVAASTRATFPLLTLPPPRPPAGQSAWREVGSTFSDKMKSDHPLLTLFLRSPTDDITFTGHVVMLMLMILSGLAISAFFTENDEHEIIKDFIVGLITACLLMPVMVVLRYAIVENNHQRLVSFLQWYAELCCFLRYEQVKLLHLGLEAAVPFGDGDEELVSMIKMAIRKQRIEERERKEKDQRQQHSAVDAEAGVEMVSMATASTAAGIGNAAGRGAVAASADASGKEDASGDKSDADSEVSTFTPAHTRCECCNSTISCSFNALPPMYRLQLLPHSAYEQIATVAQLGEAALQRVPCRGEVEMREEQLLNELALLGAWDDLLAARAQDKNSVRVAVNKVQWREWLRWAEDAAVALGGDDDADDAITTTFNTTSTVSTSATNAKPTPATHDEEEDSSLLYNREEAAYRAELLHSRVDWTRSIGLSSGDADDETDVSDVVWIDTGVTPAVDATATALAITAAAAKTRKTRKTTVPAPTSTATADVSLGRSIAASLCPAPALGWGIAPGLGGVPNENESVTVDTTFTMQHLPALDEQAAQHYSSTPTVSAYNYANGPASPRASDATLPASPRSSNAVAVAAAPVIGGTATPGSPRVSSATIAGAPRGSPSVSRASSTVTPKTANPALSLLHDPLPQLPVAVTAQRHNHIPSSAAVPLSPLPPPNPLVGPGPSLVQTSATARAQLLAALRQHTRIHIPHLLRFYDTYMPVMPRSVKGKLSVAFLVFWTLLCGFLVVVYGLQFDMAAAEAGGEDGFDIGKDEGEAESAAEWILNGLFGVALELVLYAPLLLLMDACVEARVQKKRERERAAWEYEQAAAIFKDTLQHEEEDAGVDSDVSIGADAGADAGAAPCGSAGYDDVEMVNMSANAQTDADNDKAALATYPLPPPVAPPLSLPSVAPNSPAAATDTLTTPTHTSSAPCSPTSNITSPGHTASSSVSTTQTRRHTSSTASTTAAGPSRSMERYRSLTERPDLTTADQRLMTVLQRMQIDFAPHRFFAAAALEYPLESAFPILGHMRADTFLRLCANKMKWSSANANTDSFRSGASGTGVGASDNNTKTDLTGINADGSKPVALNIANTNPNAAGAVHVAPMVTRMDNGSVLNISGVSWLNDKHSKRHQRKKQSDARRSKVSIAADGSIDVHAERTGNDGVSSVAVDGGVPITVVVNEQHSLCRSGSD